MRRAHSVLGRFRSWANTLQGPNSSGHLKRIRGGLDTAGSRQKMTGVKLDADKVPPDPPCGDKRRSGAAEGIFCGAVRYVALSHQQSLCSLADRFLAQHNIAPYGGTSVL